MAADLGIRLVALDTLVAQADFITLHMPSTDATRGLVDRELLARCKPGARIINTARGDLVDETALAEAITAGRIGGAGLDVFSEEPPAGTMLTGLSEVVATPHIGGATAEAQELVGLEAATGVREYLRAGIVRNAVNYPSVNAEEFQRLQPYLTLTERMGRLLAQLAGGRISGIGLRYYGALADETHEMLVGSTLVGLFGEMLSEAVTLVNARSVAERRGLEIVESRSSRARNFTSLISLKLHADGREYWAEGAVFEPDQPRLVRLDGVEVEVPLDAGVLIVIRNDDRPGVIGEVGTILGRHGINIATFALGRNDAGAIGVVRVGTQGTAAPGPEVSEAVLDEIRNATAVQSARMVSL